MNVTRRSQGGHNVGHNGGHCNGGQNVGHIGGHNGGGIFPVKHRFVLWKWLIDPR
jgi:hypothetical protein